MDRSPTFCALPWVNINTTPHGQVKLCCNISDFAVQWRPADPWPSGRPRDLPLAWGSDSLDDMWNGRDWRGVRDSMLRGESCAQCETCHALERRGARSPRQDANDRLASQLPAQLDTTAALPTSLELRLSTRCNLACTTCWSGSSDKIAEERNTAIATGMQLPDWLAQQWTDELIRNATGTDDLVSQTRDAGYWDQQQSWDNFTRLAPTLQRLYVTGGEPTMDRTFPRLLDQLQDCGNSSCHVSFTTNCTLWNPTLADRIGRFPDHEVQISMDAHGAANDLIRWPSDWRTVTDVMERWLAHPRLMRFTVLTVISALSVLELPDLLQHLRDTAWRTEKQITWYPIMLEHPVHLAAQLVSRSARLAVLQQLHAFDQQGWFDARHGLAQLRSGLLDGAADGDTARLRQWLQVNDQLRGCDWRRSLWRLREDLEGCAEGQQAVLKTVPPRG